MESRNISLTLEKAKEWYNSGSADLKEVALQAYTEDELKTVHFSEIKSYEDACKVLGIDSTDFTIHTPYKTSDVNRHLVAIYKLNIICKALNKGWKPSMVEGRIYYPYIRFYPAGLKAIEAVSSNNWKLGESFIADGKKYTLVCSGCIYYNYDGLAIFGCGYGDVRHSLGLLGCKSKEIAEHMSRYFSKEIFEATYAQHVGTYEWV